MNKVACIILNYFTWEDTIKEIEHVRNHLRIEYNDFVIIDNNSPNNSYEELVEYSKDKNIMIIKSEKNNGYAAGNNIGIKYAKSMGYEYGLIMNNDIIISDDNMLEKLLKIMEKDSSLAIVNPDVYMPDGYLCNRDSVRPNFYYFTFGMIRYRKKGRLLQDKGGYGYIYRPQGCCMLVDIEKMQKINYLDENTFLYCEESILAERLLKNDFKCACAICTKIIHNHSTTVKTTLQKKHTHRIVNESFKYYLEQYRGYNKLMIGICCLFNNLKMKIID